MQTYNFRFDPAINQGSTVFQADADLFVYESGTIPLASMSTAVLVKPDNGAEIVLKPGQSFRLAPGANAKVWAVRPVDPTAVVQAAFIIGAGEFNDANTLNKFTFDTGSGALPMVVQNTPANRVPVALDTATILQQSAPLMAYTNSKTVIGQTVPAGAANSVMVIDPATNAKGIVLHLYELWGCGSSNSGTNGIFLIAAPSKPTGAYVDGTDIITNGSTPTTGTMPDYLMPDISRRALWVLPPGRGLYLMAGGSGGNVSINQLKLIWQVL